MSEKNEIKRDGARATPNSGRGHYVKADSILDGILSVDYKEHAKSFGLSLNAWRKLCNDNIRNRTISGVFKVVLGEGNSKVRLWVVEDTLFWEMYELWKEQNV